MAVASSISGIQTATVVKIHRVNRYVLLLAGAVTAVLIAFAGGYGYHRDELYFLEAGRHLDWAYADQGPVTPLIARAMSEINADSLTILRVPSAIAAGVIVALAGLLTRELGGGRRAELIAAACAAVGTIVLFTGHLLSTSTFDLLVSTALSPTTSPACCRCCSAPGRRASTAGSTAAAPSSAPRCWSARSRSVPRSAW
jgi:hypothetical protein